MFSKISSILGILVILFGSFFWAEDHYALAADVNELKDRLEFKIVEDKLDSIEGRIFKLEMLENTRGMLSEIESEQFIYLVNQQKRIQAQYNALLNKK